MRVILVVRLLPTLMLNKKGVPSRCTELAIADSST